MARAQYSSKGLACADVAEDPLTQFSLWLDQAWDSGIAEANAMVLSTVSAAAVPSQRSVLLKEVDERGLVFFSNLASRKAQHLRENQRASVLFPWYLLNRQVIVEGQITRVSEQRAAEYFHSRPRQAQLGAWASRQSEALESRKVLQQRLNKVQEKFADGEVPLPEFWGGYHIRPERVEFWQGREHRLHDRILYTRKDEVSKQPVWVVTRLSP